MKILLTLLIPLSLASCGGYYDMPKEEVGRTAILNGTETQHNFISTTSFIAEAIDNAPINYTFSWPSTAKKKLVITEGKHNVVLRGRTNLGPARYAIDDVDMYFKAGRSYAVNGKLQGSDFIMWIEDQETGKPASAAVTSPYRIPESSPTILILPSN